MDPNPHQNPERKLSTAGESLYAILELQKGATVEEVKKAYRKKALRCHPDKNQGNEEATELFKQINHANAILTDDAKKGIYDSYGSMGLLMAERIGADNVKCFFCIQKPWFKVLFGIGCLLTGCCCCCCFCACCNCCCGKCGPKEEEETWEAYDDLAAEDDDTDPIIRQPAAAASVDPTGPSVSDPSSPIKTGNNDGPPPDYGSLFNNGQEKPN